MKKKIHCTSVQTKKIHISSYKIEQITCIFYTYYGKTPPPISISCSKPNVVEDKNGSLPSADSGSLWLGFKLPLILVLSSLSSSTIPNADKESSGGYESNVANIGVDGGTNGSAGLLNDDDNDDGSCLIIFDVVKDIDGVLFVGELTGIPLYKHFFSNSYKWRIIIKKLKLF